MALVIRVADGAAGQHSEGQTRPSSNDGPASRQVNMWTNVVYGGIVVVLVLVACGIGLGVGLRNMSSSATQATLSQPPQTPPTFGRVDASLTFGRVNVTALRASAAALADLRSAIAVTVGAPLESVAIVDIVDSSTADATSTRVDFTVTTSIAGAATSDVALSTSVSTALNAPNFLVSALGGFMSTYGQALGASIADVSLQGVVAYSGLTPPPSRSVKPSSSPSSSAAAGGGGASVTGSVTASVVGSPSVSSAASSSPSSSAAAGGGGASVTGSVTASVVGSPSVSSAASSSPSSSVTVSSSGSPSGSATASTTSTPPAAVLPGVVTTIVGDSAFGRFDGVGTQASLSSPTSIIADGSGNAFIADYGNHLVRKLVLSTVVVTTVAGGASSGRVNGVGTQATFNNPSGIVYVSRSDSLFVADYTNHLVRRIIVSTATVTTFAGGSASGNTDGTGTAALFNNPNGIAYDDVGNLYVADQSNHRIRAIAISTATVTTLAGSTSGFADATGIASQFNSPRGVFFSSGVVYVADGLNNRIRQIVVSSRSVTTVAGGTSAGTTNAVGTNARFNAPFGVTGTGTGTLYVGDSNNHRIRAINLSTGTVTIVAGSSSGFADGTATNAQFAGPRGMDVINGLLYVADTANHRIRTVTL